MRMVLPEKSVYIYIYIYSHLQVEGMKKGRGRPKITLVEVIKKYMSITRVTESMTLDRVE